MADAICDMPSLWFKDRQAISLLQEINVLTKSIRVGDVPLATLVHVPDNRRVKFVTLTFDLLPV